MRKNITDQKAAPGIWLIASVNAMNTNPGPLAACYMIKYSRISKGQFIATCKIVDTITGTFCVLPNNPHHRLPEILRWYTCGADGVQSRDCHIFRMGSLPHFLTHGAPLHCSAIRTSRPNCSSLKSGVRFTSQFWCTAFAHPSVTDPVTSIFSPGFQEKTSPGWQVFHQVVPFCQVNVLPFSTAHKWFMLGL